MLYGIELRIIQYIIVITVDVVFPFSVDEINDTICYMYTESIQGKGILALKRG